MAKTESNLMAPDSSEERQTTALAKLPEHLAIVKMENESIMAMCAARPRDMASIRRELLQEIKDSPSFAEIAIYCKPIGKDGDGNMKYARDLSIRAAETIAESYGYNKVSWAQEPINADEVRITAKFMDYQKCRVWESSAVKSKFFKARTGGTQRIPDDRFNDVIVPAQASKLVRECILRCIPAGLKQDIFDACERSIQEALDEPATQKIIASFAGRQVTQEMLENHLQKRRIDWQKKDRAILLGIWQGLKDEEITIHEVFGEQTAASEGKSTAAVVKDAVDKARGKAKESAKPAGAVAEKAKEPEQAPAPKADDPPVPTGDTDEIPYLETLEILLAEKSDCSLEAAAERIDSFCQKVLGKPSKALSDKTLKSAIESRIKSGDLKVQKAE